MSRHWTDNVVNPGGLIDRAWQLDAGLLEMRKVELSSMATATGSTPETVCDGASSLRGANKHKMLISGSHTEIPTGREMLGRFGRRRRWHWSRCGHARRRHAKYHGLRHLKIRFPYVVFDDLHSAGARESVRCCVVD